MSVSLAKPMWTLEEGCQLVATVQEASRVFGYHVALGGGVLNNGRSYKDIDIYFLPLNEPDPPDEDGLAAFIVKSWGPGTPIGNGYDAPHSVYRMRATYTVDGKRVDVFVLG